MKRSLTTNEHNSLSNTNFRGVLYTTLHSQLVLMSLLPDEDIGAEVHQVNQYSRCERGRGKAMIDDVLLDVSQRMGL